MAIIEKPKAKNLMHSLCIDNTIWAKINQQYFFRRCFMNNNKSVRKANKTDKAASRISQALFWAMRK